MSEKPSPQQNASNNLERLNFLTQIEKQQAVIKEVLEQIRSLQSLSQSLTSLFNNAGTLSPSITRAFHLLDTLDEEQKTLSTGKVELRLEHLELKIRDEVSYFLNLINSIDELNNNTDRAEKLRLLTSYSRISEFKRKVSLALTYRVLLFERDVSPSEFNLDVAPDLLNTSLNNIEEKREDLKSELKTHFTSLRTNILNFAQKASTSKKMSAALHKVGDAIELNLLHLSSNKPSEDLPSSIVEIEELIKLTAEVDQTTDNDDKEKVNDETLKKKEAQQKKLGLFGRLNLWVNTSDSTTWKDTKKK